MEEDSKEELNQDLKSKYVIETEEEEHHKMTEEGEEGLQWLFRSPLKIIRQYRREQNKQIPYTESGLRI